MHASRRGLLSEKRRMGGKRGPEERDKKTEFFSLTKGGIQKLKARQPKTIKSSSASRRLGPAINEKQITKEFF